MYRGGPSRLGVAWDGPLANETLWSVDLHGFSLSSPSVADGAVFIGTGSGIIYCLDEAVGCEIWHYLTDSWIGSSPAVAEGRVFIGCEDGRLYCLNESTGEALWRFETGGAVYCSPLVVDGRVLFGSHDGILYCLNLHGETLWTYSTWSDRFVKPTLGGDRRGGAIWSSPALYRGLIYFGCENGLVYCLNLTDGSKVWIAKTSGSIWSTPAVSDDIVYIGSKDGFLYAFDAFNGEMLWSFGTDGPIYSSPAIYGGLVLFGSLDGFVYCLDSRNGSLRWSFETGGPIYSSPAVADGRVYIGSEDGLVYCIDIHDGGLLWRLRIGSPISTSPALADGNLYVSSYDGRLYSIGANRLERRFPCYLALYSSVGNVHGAGSYRPGSIATFYVEPTVVEVEPGVRYVFKGWISNRVGSGYNGPNVTVTLVMDSAVIETVNWRRECKLEVVAEPAEGGVVTPPSGWYESASYVRLRARPNPGYRFKGFIGEGEGSYTGSESDVTIRLLNPIVERAIFERVNPWIRFRWLSLLALLIPAIWVLRRKTR